MMSMNYIDSTLTTTTIYHISTIHSTMQYMQVYELLYVIYDKLPRCWIGMKIYESQRLPHFPARYHSFMFEALMKWVLVLASMPTARGVVGEMPLVYWIGCQSYPLCQTRWTLEDMGKHPWRLVEVKTLKKQTIHGVGFWTNITSGLG